MADLRLYRLAFVPALLVLVVLAFSLQGAPEPAEPPPGTLEFDSGGAAKATRDVLALGETRTPGSEADNAVADLVAERFGSVVGGSLGEQTVEATVDGEDVELRNVLLTLPGTSDHAIVVLAGRDTREGEGAASSAAATGVLLELVNELSVAGRRRTLILASTSGASAEGQGARELIEGLPDRTEVDAAVVISQPGYAEPFEPHVVTAAGLNGAPVGLAVTAGAILRDRAGLGPGETPALGQIARYAIPAAAGEQAALIDGGVEAVALSSAGELPLPASENGRGRLAQATLERLGPALLALISAIDAAPAPPPEGSGDSLWIGDNLVPGWSVRLLVLALLLPAGAGAASTVARAGRNGGGLGRAFGWALEWWLPPLAFCLAVYALALAGVIPSSGVPYDPARYELGVAEGVVLVLLVALAAWVWQVLHLRRIPSAPGPLATGAAAGLVGVAASLVVWLANPYLALLLVPLTHVVAVLGTRDCRPAALVLPAVLLAAIPLALAIVYVGSALDWGATAPWQLVVLMGGGGIGPAQAIGGLFALSSVAAMALSALGVARREPRSQKNPPEPGGGSSETA